jgi:membrane protein YdbS with pleckstrin-like domain
MSDAEEVFYDGPAQMPLSLLIRDIILCFVLIGFAMLLVDWLTYSNCQLRISNRRIRITRGMITKKVDVLELYRVQDVQLQTTFGYGTIVVHSSDRTTPVLNLPIPGAAKVFEQLQDAASQARRTAGVRMLEAG